MNRHEGQTQQAPDTGFGRKRAVYQNAGGWEHARTKEKWTKGCNTNSA